MKELFRDIWYFLCRYVLAIFSDHVFSRINLWLSNKRFGVSYRGLNLKNPTSFTDKINFLKLSDEYYYYSEYADKFLVRKFVSEQIGPQFLVPLIGVYKDAEDIDFDSLPDKFILKTNHGSGWNIICMGKKDLDINKTKRTLNKWLGFNAYYLSREKQVKNIKPLILCEELLQYNIYDYKFFCFNGEPFMIQVDVGRFTKHQRAFYDMSWTKQAFSLVYPLYEGEITCPERFEEMSLIARKLSTRFTFSRIDLYSHNGNIYFGEITFFPEGGTGHFIPVEYDLIIGNYLTPWRN